MAEVAPFRFGHTTRLVFAPGSSASLGREAAAVGAARALVVCDPGITRLGLAGRALESLRAAGITAAAFDGLSENPRDGECCAAAEKARETGAQLIVGLGGGSAMDAAKAAAALATNGGTVKDWEDPRELEREPLPLLCVPTTSGTGSEVTFVAVITDEVNHYKMALRGRALAPRTALLDPELTVTMPPALTAATGMDALSHAVEAFTCKAANPVSDGLALQAVRMIARHLRTAVADGDDLDARAGMLLGSTIAGMAFANSTVGAVHSLGESLGGLYDTPHGVAIAVFLPHIFRFNAAADPGRHAEVARALLDGEGAGDAAGTAEAGARALEELARDIGIPALAELPGVTPADFEQLAETSAAAGCSLANPRPIDRDDYVAILRRAYGEAAESDAIGAR